MARILHVFSRLRRSWVESVEKKRKRKVAKAQRETQKKKDRKRTAS